MPIVFFWFGLSQFHTDELKQVGQFGHITLVDGFTIIIMSRTSGQMMLRLQTHAQLDILVAKADVLRLEDLSVGCFAANDDIQLVHRLHHSPGR